jgi:hypothetical protein
MCWYVNTVQSVYHPFTIGTITLRYVFYTLDFIILILWVWIGLVTAINVLFLINFYPLYFLTEDDCVADRNM